MGGVYAEPAGSVGDRYRLLECVAGDPAGSAAAWRAWDMLLARAVTLTVVRPGGPPAGGFLRHAHAVSTTAAAGDPQLETSIGERRKCDF